MSEGDFRTDSDSLGPVAVPAAALYGPQTQRAVEDFPVSGLRLPRRLVRALALIKKVAAEVNQETGVLPPAVTDPIVQAAVEVADGRHDDRFPLDIFQTGSGASMKNNAQQVLGHPR